MFFAGIILRTLELGVFGSCATKVEHQQSICMSLGATSCPPCSNSRTENWTEKGSDEQKKQNRKSDPFSGRNIAVLVLCLTLGLDQLMLV